MEDDLEERVHWVGLLERRLIYEEFGKWKAFVAKLEEPANVGSGRGVVIIGGTNHWGSTTDFTTQALLTLASLRRTGCRLPVELWHDRDPRLAGPGGAASARLGGPLGPVHLRDIRAQPGGARVSRYQLVTFVLHSSSFEELLYVDADNVFASDPEPLFTLSTYRDRGALFWPDFSFCNPNSTFGDIVEQSCLGLMSVESGQLMVHRGRHWKPLALATHFMRSRLYREVLGHGDCDCLLFAFLALKAPFGFSTAPVGQAGYLTEDGRFCGHTMLQMHPERRHEVAFAHRHYYKWSTFPADRTPRWRALKRGVHPCSAASASAPDAPRPPALQPWHARGKSPLLGGDDRCICSSGKGEISHCFDLPSEIDMTVDAQRTLEFLDAVEQDMFRLRAALLPRSVSVGNASMAGAGLRPGWWLVMGAWLRRWATVAAPVRPQVSKEWHQATR